LPVRKRRTGRGELTADIRLTQFNASRGIPRTPISKTGFSTPALYFQVNRGLPQGELNCAFVVTSYAISSMPVNRIQGSFEFSGLEANSTLHLV